MLWSAETNRSWLMVALRNSLRGVMHRSNIVTVINGGESGGCCHMLASRNANTSVLLITCLRVSD